MLDWVIVFTLAFKLFLLMDSIGNIPIFIALLKDFSPKKQRKIIFRELCIALIVIIAFTYIGEFLLDALDVEQDAVMIAGGIILFLIALKMIFPPAKATNHLNGSDEKEPFIVPLAVPLTAGPAVLAAVMLYAKHYNDNYMVISAIGISWIASTAILVCASYLKKLLGWRGITACERLMGLILTLIAVQMFLKGVSIYTARSS